MIKAANPDLESVLDQIAGARRSIDARRSMLVAISGIDASGTGYVTSRLASSSHAQGVRVATINVDGWLNLPAVRLSTIDPAEHFYQHAIRFEEMLSELVFPLRDRKGLHLEADHATETGTAYGRFVYEFADIDVILLEGIYLLKRAFQRYYDLSVWIECSFATALRRAIARSQEGLSIGETISAYRTIYFPAQEIHLERDYPRGAANLFVDNDNEPSVTV